MKTRETFKLTDGRMVEILPIKGSPAWLCREFYACADAPTGYYAVTNSERYIVAPDAESAAEQFAH